MDLQESNESKFPISLKESTNAHPKSVILTIPLPRPPSIKFLSNSLPNSTTSSPRFASNSSKKKCRNQASPLSNNPLARQHSVALANLERLKENHLQRSKSCGDGRSSTPPPGKHVGFTKINSSSSSIKHVEVSKVSRVDKSESIDEKFKCGAMCLFIPGLGKAKQVRARRVHNVGHNVSRKVSLEKFECGSWTSSAIINDEENDESNLFFDLPIELIQCSDDKDMTCSPVTTAFVFDKEPKGVLKNSTTTAKIADRKAKECATSHVRFSTSSPDSGSPMSCMTPRLHKAREDFNALLEAQCA
ncbi:hypothetical protein FXO38_33992 [Capsicum annuum]|uniref:uncharacterized protein LOC107845008 n=1 Tax=Capsicum annuum TaxID=4072 RepID=UPI0007BF14B0|nr:uncharacterized protein LOC107845008 [Capsicum annuum]KAF3617421.1 hypothetical protein FXO38_33992 [Capsicum annuum]